MTLRTTFEDTEKRAWQIKLSVNAIKRVKENAGVDLLMPVPTKQMTEEELGEITDYSQLPTLMRLQADVDCFADVLYQLVKPQCEKADVSQDDFLDAISGATIKEARDIFWPLYADFFHEAGQEPMAQLVELAGKGYETLLTAIDVDQTQIIEEISRKASEISKGLAGRMSTELPAS